MEDGKKRILIIVGAKSYKKEKHRLRIFIQDIYEKYIVERKTKRSHPPVAGDHHIPKAQHVKKKRRLLFMPKHM